jgi:hypothetical protein
LNTSKIILRHKEVQNTFNLPTGGGIHDALVAYFEGVHAVVTAKLNASKSMASLDTKDATGDVLDLIWDEAAQAFGTGSGLASAMEPVLDLIWDEAAQSFGAATGIDPKDFTSDNPDVKAAIEQQATDLATSVTATTLDELKAATEKVKALEAAGTITPDEAIPELEKEYEVIFEEMPDWKAGMIAVTEASRAYHEMQLLMGKESGIVTGWRWMTNGDPCPICIEIEQDCPVVKEGEAFAILGDDPLYSTITCPPAHPNCLCSLEPVLIDDIQPDTWGVTLIQPAGRKSMPLPHSWRRPSLKAAAPPRPAMRIKFKSRFAPEDRHGA